jgi:hypothetical protein
MVIKASLFGHLHLGWKTESRKSDGQNVLSPAPRFANQRITGPVRQSDVAYDRIDRLRLELMQSGLEIFRSRHVKSPMRKKSGQNMPSILMILHEQNTHNSGFVRYRFAFGTGSGCASGQNSLMMKYEARVVVFDPLPCGGLKTA